MTKSQARALEFKAYELLSSQPGSLSAFSAEQRSRIIVSAISDAQGQEHPVSKFGDSEWNLSPWFEQGNRAANGKNISWPTDLPSGMVNDCKAALYAWFKRGTPGFKPPEAGSVCAVAVSSALPFVRWLSSMRIKSFDQVKPIHVSNYLHKMKTEEGRDPRGLYSVLRILDFLWTFKDETLFPLQAPPWGSRSLFQVCGIATPTAGDGVGKTAIIPREAQAKIFNYCERVLKEAPSLLDERDSGKLDPLSPRLIHIRDCSLYVLSITSGMRNEEAVGVEAGAWRSEIKDGVEYNWVTTVERKTGKGKVDYLVPRLAIDTLDLMQRYAQPLQERLQKEIGALSEVAAQSPSASVLLRLKTARQDVSKLFIGLSRETVLESPQEGSKLSVQALKSGNSWTAFARLSELAGANWKLAPHQCRRTYARNMVESRMGKASLVFLKWQFKHSSMSMTQLYASNPKQDAALFDEVLQEMLDFKAEIIESWLGDQPLSGGAGQEIKRLRAIPIANREALLSQTASQVHIRATGHGWCLAQEKGCGGAGLYEATRCVGCKSGVIDQSFSEVWQGIHEQQLELLNITDAGPAVAQRAAQDEKWARQVINDLGVSLPEPQNGDPL